MKTKNKQALLLLAVFAVGVLSVVAQLTSANPPRKPGELPPAQYWNMPASTVKALQKTNPPAADTNTLDSTNEVIPPGANPWLWDTNRAVQSTNQPVQSTNEPAPPTK